jgi:hypothetical protein
MAVSIASMGIRYRGMGECVDDNSIVDLTPPELSYVIHSHAGANRSAHGPLISRVLGLKPHKRYK